MLSGQFLGQPQVQRGQVRGTAGSCCNVLNCVLSPGEILKMTKDESTVRCFQSLLIFGNVIVGMCGIALTAECIFFVSDQHSLYPLLEATDNDDIYGAAWIGMFVGICLFCLSVLGIVGILKSNRKVLLASFVLREKKRMELISTKSGSKQLINEGLMKDYVNDWYFILMFIVYGFEVASCITAATQRDFFTRNLFLKQMLERYQNNSPPNNDDQWKNNGVTRTWDRLMLQDNCCGVNGPSDWQKYTSAFRTENNDADYPWPRQCCVMNNLKEPLNLEACKLGVPGYYHNQVMDTNDSLVFTGLCKTLRTIDEKSAVRS
ncbi:Uroplakin-1b-like protein [Camelus ferus]|nr:Uroplakin-1b-like protein [Camelus ferus]